MQRLSSSDTLLFEPRIERVEVRRATVVRAARVVARLSRGLDDKRPGGERLPSQGLRI